MTTIAKRPSRTTQCLPCFLHKQAQLHGWWFNYTDANTGAAELTQSMVAQLAKLANKTHFCCEKLNSYEHLKIWWGHMPPVAPGSIAYYGCYSYK